MVFLSNNCGLLQQKQWPPAPTMSYPVTAMSYPVTAMSYPATAMSYPATAFLPSNSCPSQQQLSLPQQQSYAVKSSQIKIVCQTRDGRRPRFSNKSPIPTVATAAPPHLGSNAGHAQLTEGGNRERGAQQSCLARDTESILTQA